MILPNSESNRSQSLQADDVSLAYELHAYAIEHTTRSLPTTTAY